MYGLYWHHTDKVWGHLFSRKHWSMNMDDTQPQSVVKQIFFKRTRRGNVIRLVREKQLRRDLSYGFLSTSETNRASTYSSNIALTHDKLCQLVIESPHKQLLLVDTNIILHQIDLLEHQCPATSLLLITQTVLSEIQHQNMSVYRRIMMLIKDESRSYIFYPNEISDATACIR
jgi:exosome complex exonuclease DIS3/RRP44